MQSSTQSAYTQKYNKPQKVISVLNATQIDLKTQNVTYSKPKLLKKGGTVVNAYFNGEVPLFAVPEMASWGIKPALDNDNNIIPNKYFMDLQFPTEQYMNAEIKAFHDFIEQLDSKLVKDIVANSFSWLGKEKKEEIVLDNYKPILKYPGKNLIPDKSKPPKMKLKIDSKYNENKEFVGLNLQIFDESRKTVLYSLNEQSVHPTELVKCVGNKPVKVLCAIKFNGITIIQNITYPTFTLTQVVVKQINHPVMPTACVVLSDDLAGKCSDDLFENNEKPCEEKQSTNLKIVDDYSDDEDDSSDNNSVNSTATTESGYKRQK